LGLRKHLALLYTVQSPDDISKSPPANGCGEGGGGDGLGGLGGGDGQVLSLQHVEEADDSAEYPSLQ
jgi:hypothetical protein